MSKGIVMELKVKEIKNFSEDGKNKIRIIFSQNDLEKEIIFEGNGKIKTPVVEFQYVSGKSSGANGFVFCGSGTAIGCCVSGTA